MVRFTVGKPVLKEGENVIYFDNSATTKPYPEVIDSFVKVTEEFFGNPSSLHQLGVQAENLLARARTQTADLLGVKPSEVLFTSGGTESNNLAIKGAALKYRGRGKHIITTAVEHASVSGAMAQLEELGYEISYIYPDSRGIVIPENIKKQIRPDTILVSVMHVNNEVGSVQPVEQIGSLLKQYPKILFHVDHVQGIAKVPLDFYRSGVDLCTISGHKFHGLKGTGVLFVRDGVSLSPLFSGGSQEMKTRSGTENVAGMVALARALRQAMEESGIRKHELAQVSSYIREGLARMGDIIINTPEEGAAPHILNFSVKGFKAEVFVHFLEEKGIYISTTSACSSKKKAVSRTLLAMGVPEETAESAVRVSLSYQNTIEEGKIFVEAVTEALKQLGKVMK